MVKRLLTVACLALAFSAAIVSLAQAQGNGNGQGGGNSEQGSDSEKESGNSANTPAAGTGGDGAAGKKAAKADEELALEAVQSADALPLQDILRSVRSSTSDRVIDAQLFSIGDDLVYEVKVLAPDGHVSSLYFYARSGRQFSLD